MASTQANYFASTYIVLDQVPGAGGLSVTLFQEISTGKKVVAVRGTQDASDIWTDIADIAILGTPERQAQYASLKDKLTEWLAKPNKLQGQSFSVTGHSLGGFLAGALLIDFPSQIEHAYLYNAPGVGGLSASLRLLLGLETSPTLDLAKVSNILAGTGASPIAGLGVAWGTPISIAIENQLGPDVANPPAARNHSQQVLTDALAVYAAYAGLSPALGIGQIGDLLKQSAGANALTLESALDALRITLVDGAIATDSARQTPTGERDALYTNLYALQDSPNYKALANTASLKPMSGLGSGAGDQAKTDFGTLVAVNYLLPFAIEGSGSAMIGVHGDLYARWQADRDTRAAGGSELNFSDAWLADRAAMLSWLVQGNTSDNLTLTNPNSRGFEQWVFDDKATGKTVTVLPNAGFGYAADKHLVLFAKDEGQTLTGDRIADHLYGGLGTDTLSCQGGADYLEGNGGTGADSYIFASGDGWDWIDDADGSGLIRYDGTALAGGKKLADNIWRSEDQRFTYSLYDRTENAQTFKVLSIQGPAGGLWVKRWQPGQLGIQLDDTAVPPPELPAYSGDAGTAATVWYNQNHKVIDARSQAAQEIAAVGDHGEVWGSGRLIGNDTDNYLHNGDGESLDHDIQHDSSPGTASNDRLWRRAA